MRAMLKKTLIQKAGAIFVFALTALGPAFLFAQPYVGWIQRYNGPGNGYDSPAAIAVDVAGNVYVTGSSNDSENIADFATIKYDLQGKQLWVARYNGTGDSADQALAIAVDVGGNVYVTGQSYGDGTGYDCITIKYYSNGDTAWVRRYNGPANRHDGGKALKVEVDGSVNVTGYSDGGLTGPDYVTLKYDSNGNELWIRRHDAAGGGDVARDIDLDRNNNVYVTGVVSVSGTNFDYGTIKYDSQGNKLWQAGHEDCFADDGAHALAVDSQGNAYVTGTSLGCAGTFFDYATVKYDSRGNRKWVRRYDGVIPGNADIAEDVQVDSRGNVYVTGSSYPDCVTIKYDSLGNQLWTQRYDSSRNTYDLALDMALDAAGNVYVTGYTGSFFLNRSSDILTIKYDSNGGQAWVQRYNAIRPNNDDVASAIAVDAISNVYIAGSSYGYGANNNYDFIILEYSPVPILKGDLDESGVLTLDDIVSLLNCIFLGSGSCPPAFADVNCDASLSPADVVVLLLIFYTSVPPPC